MRIDTGLLLALEAQAVRDLLAELVPLNPEVTGFWLHGSWSLGTPRLARSDVDIHFLGCPDPGPAGERFRTHEFEMRGIAIDLWPHIWGDLTRPEELSPATLASFARGHVLWERDKAVSVLQNRIRFLFQDRLWVRARMEQALEKFRGFRRERADPAMFGDPKRGPYGFAFQVLCQMGALITSSDLMTPSMGRRTVRDMNDCGDRIGVPELARRTCRAIGLYDFSVAEATQWHHRVAAAYRLVGLAQQGTSPSQADYHMAGALELIDHGFPSAAMWPIWRVAARCVSLLGENGGEHGEFCRACLADLHARVGMATVEQYQAKVAQLDPLIQLFESSLDTIVVHVSALALKLFGVLKLEEAPLETRDSSTGRVE